MKDSVEHYRMAKNKKYTDADCYLVSYRYSIFLKILKIIANAD